MAELTAPQSPRARRALRRLGLAAPLLTIRGSGPGGRVLERDVLAAAVIKPAPMADLAARAATHAPGGAQRLAIARATAASAATIPHFFLQAELDASALVAFKRASAAGARAPGAATAQGAEDGGRATITDLLLRAMAIALARVPAANGIWRDDAVVAIDRPRVGLVVAHAGGLAIPVLEPTTLARTARERARAVAAARAGDPPRAHPCATSLSNLGTGRVDAFSAIIPLGQSSILAVGRLAMRPLAIGDALAVRPTLRLTLSADHRVLDGVPAADYLAAIVEALENPAGLAYEEIAMPMTVDLAGRVALVTGAARNIGKSIATALSANGATVVVADLAEQAAAESARAMRDAVPMALDVADEAAVERAVAATIARFGRIDILVNNAGINTAHRVTVDAFPREEWDRILAIDLTGLYLLSRACARHMRARRDGRIINISSVVGVVPLRLQCAFAAAKSGVNNLTRAMAVELGVDGILVNAIAPGSILTEGTRQLFYGQAMAAGGAQPRPSAEAAGLSEAGRRMLSHVPLGRPGSCEDIAAAALFLAAPESRYITGQVLCVDGGWTAGYTRDF